MATGAWQCFSCGRKGDLREFLKEMNVSPVALHHYGTILEELDELRAALKKRGPKFEEPGYQSNEPIPEALLGIFEYLPESLLEEGFEPETLAHFEVGVDTTHNRITFPLRDLDGQLVGISGRAAPGVPGPRYKVYTGEYKAWHLPAREVYKDELIWNYHRIDPFRKNPSEKNHGPNITIVEGFKAAMWLWQNGYRNVVALLGKRMSRGQRWYLEHLGLPLVLMVDNDLNGQGIKVASSMGRWLSSGGEVRIAHYPTEYRQPTDMPSEVLLAALHDPPRWASWYVQQAISKQRM